MKISVYIATSLDGFIARRNGDIDWLADGYDNNPDEDFGYQEFFDSVDVLVMGRKTFQKVLEFNDWPYGDKKVIVLANQTVPVPEKLTNQIDVVASSPSALVSELRHDGAKHLYIDGGATIQGFLREGLVTDMTITRIPILLGKGIPLFGRIDRDIHLQHVSTWPYKNGFVQSHYEVVYNK